MRILVVFTGGTIGCATPGEDGVLEVLKSGFEEYFLIGNYDNIYDAEFHTTEPLNKLSENMTIADWNVLLKSLKKVNFSEYDGIVIAHGTDTMAFTAAMFGMLLSGIHIPVIFIGSNYALTDDRADGHQNFADAVSFIKNVRLGGTFVIIKSKVYISTRINQSRHFFNEFTSPNGEIFGTVTNGKFEFSSPSTTAGENAGLKQAVKEFEQIYERTPIIEHIETILESVFLVKPYVGLNYECLSFPKEIKAVLHETYHSATICEKTENMKFSLMEFYKRHKNAVSIYIAPFYSEIAEDTGALKYSSTFNIINAGVKTINDMSLESSYAKLLLAYSLYSDEKQIDNFLNEPLFFEKIY